MRTYYISSFENTLISEGEKGHLNVLTVVSSESKWNFTAKREHKFVAWRHLETTANNNEKSSMKSKIKSSTSNLIFISSFVKEHGKMCP